MRTKAGSNLAGSIQYEANQNPPVAGFGAFGGWSFLFIAIASISPFFHYFFCANRIPVPRRSLLDKPINRG
jgi:hypothetical protein